MITRHLTHISSIKLKSTIQLIQLDPEYKFICINVPEHYTIYLISCDQFALELQKSLLNYRKMKLYSSKLIVEELNKIDTSKHNTMSGVTIIAISKTWQGRKFLAYATLQHVHIYEVMCKQSTISIRYMQTPIIALRFHYSALYLGHFNDDMQIYQIDYKKNLWLSCDSIIKMPDQFLRIVMYDDDKQQQGYSSEDDNNRNQKEWKITKRNENDKQQQKRQGKSIERKFYQRYHSVDEIMQIRNLVYYDNNSQSNPIQQQPYTPVILYQRNDNSLWKADYDHQQKKYVHIELCPPMTFECLPIADYYSDQEQENNGDKDDDQKMVMKTGIKRNYKEERKSAVKTVSKSGVKNNSERKELQGKSHRKQLNASSPPPQSPSPLTQCCNNPQPIKLSDPLMYRLSACLNYLIYDTQTTYKILSRQQDWQQIYSDLRQPCINPFYEEIERRVYLDMWMSMSNNMYEDVFEYLSENYEFLMIAFTDSKMYGNELKPVELTVIKIQLLVVDKQGLMLQNQKKQITNDIITNMNKIKRMQLDTRWDELSRFYPEDMVKQIQKMMKQNKDIKLLVRDKSKNIQDGNNDDVDNSRYKTPGKEWEKQNNQNLEVQVSESGRFYLRSFSRSSKSKNRSDSKSKKKIQEDSQNNKKQYNPNNQSPQNPSPPTLNPSRHTYTFPIFSFEYLKSQPFRMQWLGVQQLIFTNEQKRVNYMSIHPNVIYCTIYKIYIDNLCPGVIESFKRIIDKFVDSQRKEEMNSESEEVEDDDGEDQDQDQGQSEHVDDIEI